MKLSIHALSILRSMLPLALAALLAACGGGGGGGGGPPNVIQCVPANGGFTGDPNQPAGGDGGDGGSGAGVGSGDGAIRAADVKLYDATGTLLGTAVSDARGLVTLRACGKSGPFRIDFEGRAGAAYFDEGVATRENADTNAWRPFPAGEVLSAWVADLTQHRVVSVMTNAAAEEVKRVAGTGAVTTAIVNAANEKMRLIFNTSFAGSGVAVDDLTRLPEVIDSLAALKRFDTNARGRHAQAIASLSKAAANANPTLASPGREMSKQLAADLGDGVIDGRRADGQPVATASTAAYQPAAFTQTLVAQTLGRLSLALSGNGSVQTTGPAQACPTGGGQCFAFGASVTLTAQVPTGFEFRGWTGACSGTALVCTLTMAGDRDVGATFAAGAGPRHLLGTTASGPGRITSNPVGVSCPGDCGEEYPAGTTVVLTATPDSGAAFTGWTGACSGTQASCVVTMDAAKTVGASFGTGFQLTTATTGDGSVGVTPAGTSCGTGCTLHASGTVVTLVPLPAAGSVFSGWSGACTGNGACTVTMSQARQVTARFITGSTLTVTKSGAGTGTIFSAPAGIDCGAQCSQTFVNGTRVTLTAVAAQGSTFVGWSGECTGTGSCSVTVSGSRSVEAQFSRPQTLVVTKLGAGNGLVRAVDGSLSCGSQCSRDYATGVQVTLVAEADGGSLFVGWGGACVGFGTCVVTMDRARDVSATFSTQNHALNVSVTGPGSVGSTPGGIACPGDCSETYSSLQTVTLTALPNSGASFVGWSGDCIGSGNCVVAMNAPRNVSATFATTAYILSGTINGLLPDATGLRLANGGVQIDIPGGATSFSFGPVLVPGASYNVTVARQPGGQTCTVSNGSGVTGSAHVTNVRVDCSIVVGLWAWERGSQGNNAAGLYGIYNVTSPNNMPGALSNAVIWSLPSGEMWVFGGYGYDVNGQAGSMNHLWRFNPATKLWTWVTGSATRSASGIYGTRGVPSLNNTPGARWGSVGWVDAAGRLWMFGGKGYGAAPGIAGDLADLWRFDPADQRWTWIAGLSDANPDALGGHPDARHSAVAWRDNAGQLWLFGGINEYNDGDRYFNDLWRFNIATGLWTYVRGGVNQNAIYGTQGVPALANTPGARSRQGGWADAAGNLWMFGGYGFDAAGQLGRFNDLWRYQPAANTWTWVGGSNLRDPYETAAGGLPTWPGSRTWAATATAPDGRMWLHGGVGRAGAAAGSGYLNDLWVLDPATVTFSRAGGSSLPNQLSVFGPQGVLSPTAVPGGRTASVMRFDAGGQLWLFGGSVEDDSGFLVTYRNDLWRFLPPGGAGAAAAPAGAARR